MDLNGKVAVITGGGFGVGKAAGALMGKNGVKLVLVDMNKEVLDTAVGEMKDKGYEVIGVQADVADLDAMRRVADEAYGTYGKVNIGMFNAGLGGGGSFLDPDMSGCLEDVAARARSAERNLAAAPDPRIDVAPARTARRVNDGDLAVFAFTVSRRSHHHLRRR